MTYCPAIPVKKALPLAHDCVEKMMNDKRTLELVKVYGLDIMKIISEDCARYMYTCWGPSIFDVTLVVDDRWMPVVRVPNFLDPITTIPSSEISLIVGNESPDRSNPLQKISLQEYLETIDQYTDLENPMDAPDRDHQVLVVTQTCFLPIEKDTVDFQVGLYNYQSTENAPTTLVLVCTKYGTSAQVVGSLMKALDANDHGMKSSFAVKTIPSQQLNDCLCPPNVEKQILDHITIIQIPIRPAPPILTATHLSNVSHFLKKFGYWRKLSWLAIEKSMANETTSEDTMAYDDGADETFPRLNKYRNMERHPDFPIRVNVQFYKTTNSGDFSQDIAQQIAHSMNQVKERAIW